MINDQQLFLLDVARLINFSFSQGIRLTGGELYRTIEQQKIHFDAGRSKTMNSKHMHRLAIDFNFFIDGQLTYEVDKLRRLGEFWEKLDPKNRWGGNFTTICDTLHFERNVEV